MLHDNIHPHMAPAVHNTLHSVQWQVYDRPSYSPDLSLCDVHAFRTHYTAMDLGWEKTSRLQLFYWQARKFLAEGLH